MSQFKTDLLHWKDYDYVVINNNLDECYHQIHEIIMLETQGSKGYINSKDIEKKIEELIV